jgi:hypothetical protein
MFRYLLYEFCVSLILKSVDLCLTYDHCPVDLDFT